jgi:catechol 2,3-dioxygenase-like lactoylglutathione lyase family enzyme
MEEPVIKKMSHVTVWVLDQDEARRFYTEKLGFEVRIDASMDNGFRWLCVGPPDQPDLQLVLMAAKPGPMMDPETAAQIAALVKKGALGAGVFYTPNCRATYEELRKRGVEFVAPPEDKFYGTEALLKDNSGNWFSMTTPAEHYSMPGTKPESQTTTQA